MAESKTQYSLTPLFDTLQELASTPPKNLGNYQKDFHYTYQFLYSYRGSEATYNSYRRELERFLHWSWNHAKKSIYKINRQDIEQFIEFCKKPPKNWIGTKQEDRFLEQNGQRIPNPRWRPFVLTLKKVDRFAGYEPDIKKFSLSQKALQAIFSVLSSFYNYLIQEQQVEFNPVAQIRQKSKFIRKSQNQTVIRRLSAEQWSYVLKTAEHLAKDNQTHERTLFIMNALYGMYLRISELSANKNWTPLMNHFQKDSDGNWWFTTVGKGNKQRIISVSDSMLNALKRYRQYLNLVPLPLINENTPLLQKNKGIGPISSTRQIREIVQQCFDKAYDQMLKDNFPLEDAAALKTATVHWLRHTGISDDVKVRPREHVRDDAGHSSSAITDKYIDVELRERHASKKKQPIKPD